MNGPMFQKIYTGVFATLLTAAVIGVWTMYGEVKTLSATMTKVVEQINRRELAVDKRLERLEDHIWPRPRGG